MREQFAAQLVERGRRHARRRRSALVDRDAGDAARGARAAEGVDRRRRRRVARASASARAAGRGRDRRSGRPPARARTTQLLDGARGLHGPPEARCASSSGAAARSTRAASTGARPRRSRSRRCVVEGIPVRLTGQDTERGTFSHRHLVLHDAENGQRWTPIQHLDDATASFEVFNSPLSEYACVGFEYGYSVAAAGRARAVGGAVRRLRQRRADRSIDQFVSSGLAKWGQTSRLTLLLPHGYEGNGPEHSSARARALPPARRAGEHPHRELHDGRAVLPPAAPPGARRRPRGRSSC